MREMSKMEDRITDVGRPLVVEKMNPGSRKDTSFSEARAKRGLKGRISLQLVTNATGNLEKISVGLS